MKILHVRRAVAGLSLGAVAAAGLAGVPSPAHAAIDEAHLGGWYSVDDDEGCTPSAEVFGDEIDVPWSDDNVTVAKGGTVSQTFTAGDTEDKVDTTSSIATSITSTPLGNVPATIKASATASASALARGAETACAVEAEARAQGVGFFTLAQPAWVTLTATSHGHSDGFTQGTSMIGIGSADNLGEIGWGYLGMGGDGLAVSAGHRGSSTSSTLLPAGQYGVVYGAFAYARAAGTDEGKATYGSDFTIEFSKPGSASTATGKGASKVQFGERDCANGNVAVNLAKKTVKKAKRVAVRVNGAKGPVLTGKGLKGKKPKAKSIVVPTSVTGVTKVKVKITLANGRRVQATRSYLPCK